MTQSTKGRPPRLPFARITEAVMGTQYDLSLAFIGDRRSRTLNRAYRGKDKPTNVLSFPLSKRSGEVLINLHQAKRDAPHFDETYQNFVGYLFIHGLLHLKGMEHGSRMESKERAVRKQFGI